MKENGGRVGERDIDQGGGTTVQKLRRRKLLEEEELEEREVRVQVRRE